MHWEDGTVFAEPGVDLEGLGDRTIVNFTDRNLFFGGAQAVQRLPGGALVGAGDPRRGGAAVSVGA